MFIFTRAATARMVMHRRASINQHKRIRCHHSKNHRTGLHLHIGQVELINVIIMADLLYAYSYLQTGGAAKWSFFYVVFRIVLPDGKP